MFRSVIPSHQNKPCFLAFLFGGQSSPHICCFRPRFHFTPLPGLPHLWCVSVAVSQVLLRLPLSFLVLPPQPSRSRPWLLRACTATVTLFPHSVTSRPGSPQPRVTGPPSSSAEPSVLVPSWYVVFHHVFSALSTAPPAALSDKRGWVQSASWRRRAGLRGVETLHHGHTVRQQ